MFPSAAPGIFEYFLLSLPPPVMAMMLMMAVGPMMPKHSAPDLIAVGAVMPKHPAPDPPDAPAQKPTRAKHLRGDDK
jgi:hypothetical protein